uniref:Uncharacterized protein n=1 Tax=Chrysemys picta bellii TaxID=8478 RepID=A0A8C3F9I7_CHRPI
MSMILFACVVRVRDGLPLSASTDFHLNQDFLECRKRLKALSLILAQYPDRGTATEQYTLVGLFIINIIFVLTRLPF